jgi:predicted DNA-binding transcriptional regulator AlpA
VLTRREIAERWRISTDTLRKTHETRPEYPPPILKLSRKAVYWDEAAIDRYAQRITERMVG